MGRFKLSDYESKKKEISKTTTEKSGIKENKFKFDFFNLKEDGDEALVRFPYKDASELDTVSVHALYKKQGDKYPTLKVACLREPYGSVDKCPLCRSGENKPSNKFFCKFIEYVKNKDGIMEIKAKVWERSMAIATKISSYIDEYGDLSDMVFKIKRYGKNGDKDTRYEILPTRKDIYNEVLCPKDFSAFEGLDLIKLLVRNKTEDEMNYYIDNGEFPEPVKEKTTPEINEVKENKTSVEAAASFESVGSVRIPVKDDPKSATTDPTSSGARPRRYEYK